MLEHVRKKEQRSGRFPTPHNAGRLPATRCLLVASTALLILCDEPLAVNEGQGLTWGAQRQLNLTVDEKIELLTPENASPTIRR